MLLLRVFLLVMLIGDSWSAEEDKIVPNCDKMKCFVPARCRGSRTTDLKILTYDEKVSAGCEAIAKIRSYSNKLYLIVLETYDDRFSPITLKQGNTILECARDETTVTAKFNGQIVNMLRSSKGTVSDPFFCEFFVRNETNPVFESPTEDVTLKASSSVSSISGATFLSECAPTCDPESVNPGTLGAVGDKTVFKVDVQLSDLVCSPEQKLMFRKGDASNFEEAPGGKIECKESSQRRKYVYDPEFTEAHCEVTTCTQCNSAMAPPIPNLETFADGGCTKLRCKNNDRLKIGSSAPKEGSAECKFENNQHVWKFNGETIKADSTVTCQEKKKCFSTKEDVERMCENCELGPDNMPICVGDSATLMYQTKNMTVLCDDVTGTYFYNDGKTNYTSFREKLHCEGKKATDGAAAKQAGSTDKTTLTICIVVLILVLAIIGSVVGVWLYRKSKKAKKDANKKQEYTAPGGGPSRSGHSRSGHSGTPDRSAQSTANQEDPKSTKPFERNVLVPGNGSDMTPVSRPDTIANQSQRRKPPRNKKPEEEPKLTEEEQAALENADTVFKKDEDSAPENINTARSEKSAVPEAANDRGGDRGGGEGAARPGSARPANELCGTGPPNMPRPKGGRSQLEEMNKMKKKSATPK